MFRQILPVRSNRKIHPDYDGRRRHEHPPLNVHAKHVNMTRQQVEWSL